MDFSDDIVQGGIVKLTETDSAPSFLEDFWLKPVVHMGVRKDAIARPELADVLKPLCLGFTLRFTAAQVLENAGALVFVWE